MHQEKSWHEFLTSLALYEHEAAVSQQMPAQYILEKLQHECFALSGNCSAIYNTLLKTCELAGVTAYKYADLPTLNSNDGYLSIFDKRYRGSFLIKGCTNPFTTKELAKRRYLLFYWQRTHHLHIIDDNSQMVTLRSAGTKELSKFCVNAIPYQPAHGLGISEYTNNIVCDIEKIAREAEYLNPPKERAILDGEVRFNVGQNSNVGSSIPVVLHSHHSAGTIEEFKIYTEANAPLQSNKFPGTYQVTQVGNKHDAFFIKLHTTSVTDPAYLDFCLNLRLTLAKAFGSNVDFYFHIIPTHTGDFVTLMAPFAKLIKQMDDKLGRIFINPETNENNVTMQVVEHLHLGNASKKWEIDFSRTAMIDACIKDGRGRLGALYDFTAKQGARDLVQEYISRA